MSRQVIVKEVVCSTKGAVSSFGGSLASVAEIENGYINQETGIRSTWPSRRRQSIPYNLHSYTKYTNHFISLFDTHNIEAFLMALAQRA